MLLHPHDRRLSGAFLPRIALAELHVIVHAPRRGGPRGLVHAALPVLDLASADGDEGGGARRGAAAQGELAGDFGDDVAEEVGHGDEAAADDARGDFGDTSINVGSVHAGSRCAGKGQSSRPHRDGE